MRFDLSCWILGTGLGLAACSGSPKFFTGPGTGNFAAPPGTPSTGLLGPSPATAAAPTPSPTADDTVVPAPGLPTDLGERYAPTIAPTYGSDGRYYGYN